MNRMVALAAGAAVASGAALWQKYQSDKAEKELWAEVSDAID